MRQTNIIRRCHKGIKYAFCIMLLVISCITALHADVANVAVNTNFPGSSNRINGSGYVDLQVTWIGDSPSYTAKYKLNGNVISTEGAITTTSTNARIQASTIGDTNGTAVPILVQIVDNAGNTAEASSQGVIVDTRPPTLTANVTNGPNFSQNSSVRIQINSNKEINAPTVTCNGVSGTMEGSLNTGTSFVYNLQLSSAFANGSYNVDITATDLTEPAGGANSGSTRCSFTVGTSATGATTIDSATPASPSNAQTISLSGSAPSGVAKITLLEGTSEVASINSNSTSWSMSITPQEGQHSYVLVSYDSLDQEISRSSAFTYVVDRTAPSAPTVSTEGVPTQTNATSISLTVNVEGYSTEITPPVMLQGYNNGTPVGNKFNVTTSGSPINVTIPLSDGTNSIYFKTVDAAGNESGNSESITINKSGSATAAVASVLVDTYSVPAPARSMLGVGQHSINLNFNQGVSNSAPTINVVCGGGSTISVKGTWQSNTEFIGSFTIPANGGAAVDGAAKLSVTDVKDSFGNILPEYIQEAAFVIDSTAPTSTINGETNVYISATKQTVTLNGTVDDGTGSGVDFLTLIVTDPNGAETTTNVPLQTNAVSPWTYTYDASGLGDTGTFVLKTSATDRALPEGNKESYSNKTGINIVIDKVAPAATRVSLNNTGVDMVNDIIIASDVTRIVAVASDTGAGLDLTSPNYILTLTGPDGVIPGEKTNNGVDTIYYDFSALSASGSYTITFTPVDKAGNTGETVTKKFSINRSAPDQAEFFPPSQCIANATDETLAKSIVKVKFSSQNGSTPSYTSSTISVKYNGNEVGKKAAPGSPEATEDPEALIAILHDGNLERDPSNSTGKHDGNYYITVVPYSTSGIAGNPITSSFIYDTVPPVITQSEPSAFYEKRDGSIWFGKDLTKISITVSDSPKDQVENFPKQNPDNTNITIPGDSSWYSGAGSGFNSTISSFSWTMDTASNSSFIVEGNKLTLDAPRAPASGAAGVEPVNVQWALCDRVTQGTKPNTLTSNAILMYDYLEPKVTIKTKNGLKFTSNFLKISGTVEDQGTDPDLQVTQIQYNEGNTENESEWKDLTVKELPKKSASFTAEINIANKTDGTYNVSFRALDRVGNKSAKVDFSYIVDRTPPSPAELTIPLPDYTINKRTQNYKWAGSNGADAYLLQISDDSSFNNILNATVSTEYPTLKGTVCKTTDGSFSLPKDGTYYWRVASIEKCEDGYNMSDFSQTRKLVVDSVKPYILSVSPSPSSSNTVSTGMVTFTIRFSETLDATINMSATLTSAGGQVMKIEKINCTGDTWTGTTVIPKNNSSVYDGTAVISVQGASDLAGNVMSADSSHTIVINTGPAFTTKLFSNPANEYEITILTKASESLQNAPSVYVKQNSVKTPVTMNFLKDRFYSGSYKIDKENPGAAYITLSGTDLYGMVGNSTVEFRIADVNASSRLSITTSSGRSSLKAAEGATYKPTSVFLIERECLESPFSGEETINSSVRASAGIRASVSKPGKELVGVLGLDEIGPSTTKLKKCMLYTADVNGENINVDPNKVHVYRQDSNGKWIFQGGTLKNYKISAQLTGLGRLALMADLTAPRLNSMSPANLEKLDTLKPEIKGQFEDNGSGLQKSSFKLSIDGLQVNGAEMENDGSFKYQPKQALQPGKHVIEVEVKDNAGNAQRKAFAVEAPIVTEGEFRPYPNPARGNYIKFAYNFGAVPENVSLKIYDSAGHLVAKFNTGDFAKSGRLNWDLTNQKGNRVANGTYIYRLEYTANGQKIKKRGNLAILK